ncbi:MAG TPA: DUF3105 domain-containing protein [Actinomycetota bacterium]|nr:DUF3105 domain-containing protein [Actinomycetota bacterium]
MADQTRSGARPTKNERREEARRKRIELQRQAERARRNRMIAIAVTVVVVAAAVAFLVTRPEERSAATERATQVLATSSAQTEAAGCTEVQDVGAYQPEGQDRVHIGGGDGPAEMPALSTYPSTPPASGPHAGTPLPAGVYSSPPPMDALIHSLEHGAAVVWYDPEATSPGLSEIQDFYAEPDVGSRVIVAPYDYPDEGDAGALPQGTQMALVSWHHVQTCAEANLGAAFGFTARWSAPPFEGEDYLGEAPEPGAQL